MLEESISRPQAEQKPSVIGANGLEQWGFGQDCRSEEGLFCVVGGVIGVGLIPMALIWFRCRTSLMRSPGPTPLGLNWTPVFREDTFADFRNDDMIGECGRKYGIRKCISDFIESNR